MLRQSDYAMQLVEGQSLAELIGQLRTAQRIKLDGPVGQAGRTITCAREGVETPQTDVRPTEALGDPHIDEAAPQQVSLTTDTNRDLQAVVSTVPTFDSQEYHHNIAWLGVQAARALDHAHQHGILHRDIKPGNLIVDMDGKLQVTDFGLARIEADAGMTMTGDLLGTLAYMSDDLQRFLENRPIEARRPSPLARFVKWSQRHRVFMWSIFVASLLVAAGSAISSVFVVRAYHAESIQRIEAEEQRKRANANLKVARLDETYFHGFTRDALRILGYFSASRKQFRECHTYIQQALEISKTMARRHPETRK